jgi:hypothetical protein
MAHPRYPQTESPHYLHLKELGFFLATYSPLARATPPKLKNGVAQTFSAQLDRDVVHLRTLAELPSTMTFMTELFDQSWQAALLSWKKDFATEHETDDPGIPTVEAIESDFSLHRNAIRNKAAQILQDKLAETRPLEPVTIDNMPANVIRDGAREHIDMLMGLSLQGHQCGLQFLATLCVRTWTIFEVLAGDLWEAALNSNPNGLGKSAAEYQPAEAEDGESVVSGDRKKRNEPENKTRTIRVPLNKLVECNWNLSNRLGTYSRDKFNFQKIDKIKEAYVSVWPKAFEEKINAIFDQDLKEAVAIRNAIIHSGGHPDEKFKWQVGRDSDLRNLPDDHHIPLDGPWVNQIAYVVTSKAQELIVLVDESLRPSLNPPKPITAA